MWGREVGGGHSVFPERSKGMRFFKGIFGWPPKIFWRTFYLLLGVHLTASREVSACLL